MVFVLVSFQYFASKALGLPYLTVCLSTLRDGPLDFRTSFENKKQKQSQKPIAAMPTDITENQKQD